jgi:hypothetical protein
MSDLPQKVNSGHSFRALLKRPPSSHFTVRVQRWALGPRRKTLPILQPDPIAWSFRPLSARPIPGTQLCSCPEDGPRHQEFQERGCSTAGEFFRIGRAEAGNTLDFLSGYVWWGREPGSIEAISRTDFPGFRVTQPASRKTLGARDTRRSAERSSATTRRLVVHHVSWIISGCIVEAARLMLIGPGDWTDGLFLETPSARTRIVAGS